MISPEGTNSADQRKFRNEHQNAAISLLGRAARAHFHVEQMLPAPLTPTRDPLIARALLHASHFAAPFIRSRESSIMRRTKIDITDSGGRGGFGQQTRFGHPGNRVDFQHERFAAFGQDDIDAPIHLQVQRPKCAQRQLLDLMRFFLVDLGRANVRRAASRLRIQKRILIVEIVKTALRNYLDDWQGLITEDTNRQFSPQTRIFRSTIRLIEFRSLGNGEIQMFCVFNNDHADGGPFARRLDHEWKCNSGALARMNDLPFRRRYTVIPKFFLRPNLVEGSFASVTSSPV